MNSPKKKWGIVGGGMLGMYLALKLSEAGEQITLIEAKSSLGGLAASWRLDNYEWDKFYHVILLSDTCLRSFLKDLGLENELNWVETKTGFYTNGRLHSMSNSFEFLQFPPLSLLDKLRLGFTIFYASRINDWKSLEDITVADWLTKWSGKNTFEKIWLPLLRAKLGDHYQHTAATFIWTTIQRMYKARRTGLKKEMFGYVTGGYSTIIEALENRLISNHVNIASGHKVTQIKAQNDGLINVTTDNGNVMTFDEVVTTIPSALVPEICQDLSPDEIHGHNQIEYLGIICASVLLNKAISPYYVTNITDQTPFTGIIEMTNIVNPESFGGHRLVYLPRYIKSSNPIFHWKDHQIELLFQNALMKMYPDLTMDNIQAFKIAKSPYVFALPTLNYSEKLPPISTSLPGFHVLNSSHIVNGTLNVNETLQLVDKALPDILQKAYNRTLAYEPSY